MHKNISVPSRIQWQLFYLIAQKYDILKYITHLLHTFFFFSSGSLSFIHLTKTITNFLQFTFPVFGIYNSGQKSLVQWNGHLCCDMPLIPLEVIFNAVPIKEAYLPSGSGRMIMFILVERQRTDFSRYSDSQSQEDPILHFFQEKKKREREI